MNARVVLDPPTPEWCCTKCGAIMTRMQDVGYEGPGRNNKPDPYTHECNVHMDWVVLCYDCYTTLNRQAASNKRGPSDDGHNGEEIG